MSTTPAAPSTAVVRALGALSALELVSVVALLANLATVHDPGTASVVGPLHGALYLAVAATALLARGLRRRTRLWAIVPLLGGPATLVNLRLENGSA